MAVPSAAKVSLPNVQISCSGNDATDCSEVATDGQAAVVYWMTDVLTPSQKTHAVGSGTVSCAANECTGTLSNYQLAQELPEGNYTLVVLIDGNGDATLGDSGEPEATDYTGASEYTLSSSSTTITVSNWQDAP